MTIQRATGLALVVILTACGGGQEVGTPTTEAPHLPPHTYEDLLPILQPLIGDDYTVTRASLIETATYRETPDGTHLAVYLEPHEDLTSDEFARAVSPTAAAFLPIVFDRWPGLASFDVCLEPYDWPDDSTPPSVTIVNVTREMATPVDWATIDLTGLLARSGAGFTIWADFEVRNSSTWQGAAGATP